MKIEFSNPTEYDRRKFEDTLSPSCLDGRIKVTATDEDGNTAEMFIEQEIADRLGEEYIREHIAMYYSKALCGWFLKLSQNDYFNDTERYPEKVIQVKFDGIEGGTGREIYKGIETGHYYLREVHFPRERFAKWYVCGKRRSEDDGNEPRANLVFECNGQREKVQYDDWNGVAAYSNNFNEAFSDASKR
ncbi:MAG: hypothetical protein K2H01_11465 [Ruminococcus sp.]|nr:hypothetical protein [Ruminococcus sp.]